MASVEVIAAATRMLSLITSENKENNGKFKKKISKALDPTEN